MRLTIDTEYVKAKAASEQVSKQLMISLDDAILANTIGQDPFLAALKNNLFDSILGALHWGVAAFCAKQKGDGQHICSTEHGHHSKEPSQLFQAFFCWQDL